MESGEMDMVSGKGVEVQQGEENIKDILQ